MDQIESPTSSDSAHTPLQDEHSNACEQISTESLPAIIEDLGETEEQLDYEEFIENNEETKLISETEEGEYNSGDDNCVVIIADNDDKKSLENGEINSEDDDDDVAIIVADNFSNKPIIKYGSDDTIPTDNGVGNHTVKCDGELAEGELKAEEEETVPLDETPWERGLRLARERRELAKQKKVQEKDKLKEKQLNINLDNIEEVEPISKPQIERNYEMNQQLLKAMQPIVILPEEPRNNEMILEYYLSEADYQHRPRFIPSRLYTLDPWEVEEWKRELDMMKMENEIGRIASNNKHKRIMAGSNQSMKRMGRRGSVSSSVSSRSSSLSAGGGKQSQQQQAFNQSNRQYELQTSQYALSRTKPNLDKGLGGSEFSPNKSAHHLHHNQQQQQRGKRDLPPEFKNRIVSSSRSSSRSSSGSQSSSSGSSSSSRSSTASSPRKHRQKQHRALHAGKSKTAAALQTGSIATATTATSKKPTAPAYRTIKKPALGRARSDSSGSSKSSDSSSTSSDSSSSQSSASSNDSKVKSKKSSNKTDKQFISSWFTKTATGQNQLEATIVPDSSAGRTVTAGSKAANVAQMNGDITDETAVGEGLLNNQLTVMPCDNSGSQLLSAGTRPGVKLKLVSRPKPVILPNQTASKSGSGKTPSTSKDKSNKKQSSPVSGVSKMADNTQTTVAPTSSIFNNSKSIFSTIQSTVSTGSSHKSIDQLTHSTKETALKSNLAATQLEMQQEFLRNYKDKIAIYRSQLSYQQQNPLSGQHPSTLTHNQPPPIKGPITVMSVTSKKTGPPKTQVKVTDRYSQHEEHSRRYNHHHYSPNYRNDHRDNVPFGNNNNNNNNRNRHGSRNRSRSFDNNDRSDWGDKSKEFRGGGAGGGGADREYHGRPGRNYDNNNGGTGTRDNYNDSGKFRQSDNYRSNRNNDFNDNKFRDNNRSSYNDNNTGGKYRDQHDNRTERNRYEPPRHDFDRANRFDRNEERPTRSRGEDRNNSRNFNRDSGSFSRDDRPRDRFRNAAADREFNDDRTSDTNISADKRNNTDSDSKHREDKFDNPKPRPRNLDRDSLTASTTTTNVDSTAAIIDNAILSKPIAATLPPITVPKEKRREELLKQLKAVEDAIAKKKAKIDK